MERRCMAVIPGNELITPSVAALLITLVKTSMAMTNSNGEIGSPCLKPCACMKLLPGTPLTITLVLAVLSRAATHPIHFMPNPLARSTSKRNGQANESKAFGISSFRNTPGSLRAWIFLAT